jgi:hypothetical protein
MARFISSLIDFSFIRSIVAHRYCITGFAYDPVSLFLLELFRYIEKFPDMKAFVDVLRDPIKGKHYRLYAGIDKTFIPCEATFTNFKDRLGEAVYNSIFHALVHIADLLGFLSFKIIATDGTLFPTNAQTFPGNFEALLRGPLSGPRFEVILIFNLYLDTSILPP